MLEPAGPQAQLILQLWHVIAWTCTGVFAAILGVLAWVLWRAPRSREGDTADMASAERPEPGPRRSVGAAVVVSVLLLLALVVASVFTDRALARMSLVDAVNIEITGHQWWWSARYVNGPADATFTTANEVHIPVGRPVLMTLKAEDVIHSLWVPRLAGKKDLIPGRTASLQLRADEPGVYQGRCAEFCGLEHAFMGLLVVADPPAQYEAWVAAQRQGAVEPAGAQAVRGRELFQTQSCALCHAVQGTSAGGQHGPDLTHVAGRRELAAGTLPNTPAHLAAWISDPQKHKPGTNMPATPLSQDDLSALVAYLGTLK
ncbi:MAG: cytochrome c oxidase subunit II [Burkholderiales bacterium]|nr:cytochrome c oxidase subunit II [Burkholderiales bacterium]